MSNISAFLNPIFNEQLQIMRYMELKNYDFNPGISNNPLINILQNNPNETPYPPINDILPSYSFTVPEREICSNLLPIFCKDKKEKGINCLTFFSYSKKVLFGSSSGHLSVCNINDDGSCAAEVIHRSQPTSSCRALKFNKEESSLLVGDKQGNILLFNSYQRNSYPKKTVNIHNGMITDISFSINDSKFITSGEDKKVAVIDFGSLNSDLIFAEKHLSDVKTCDWNPYRNLVVSGGKDKLLHLWDPSSGDLISTLHIHIDTINRARFNKNGNWLLSGGKDNMVKVTDIRMMRELQTFKGHSSDVNNVLWHPIFEEICCSAGADSRIIHWKVGDERSKIVEKAHEKEIFDLCYNKLGTLMVSGGNEGFLKFWGKARFKEC